MPLNPAQLSTIAAANRGAVAIEFQNIAKNWSSSRWLQVKNRYERDVAGRLKLDKKANKPFFSPHLRQYISSSSVMHCIDGWSYLGRAVDALLRGDGGAACHLAYYSELRAAMALLSAEGIGVFDRSHFIVDSARQCHEVPDQPPTHAFVWDALENWSAQNSAADLLFDIVQPGGVRLHDWLSSFSIGGGFKAVLAQHWLVQWGLDLKRLSADRFARNVASYRPNEFSYAKLPGAPEVFASVRRLWRAFEPQESARFSSLDASLLKSALELNFKNSHSSHKTPARAKKLYTQMVGAMLHQVSPQAAAPSPSTEWADFLLTGIGKPDRLLADAGGNARYTDSRHPQQVLARAALLLRIATGAANKLCRQHSNFSDALKFWWVRFGTSRNLWEKGEDATAAVDLWVDVFDSLAILESMWSDNTRTNFSYSGLTNQQAIAFATLGTCERVGIWGLGI